jgi:organic radical activating enzyme
MNYLDNVRERLQKIESCREGFVLMGAGPIGVMALVALRHMGLRVGCFADNSVDKQGGLIEGIEILSPKTAHETLGDRDVVIAVASPRVRALLREQLSALGFSRFHDVYPLAHYFLAHNLFGEGLDDGLTRDIAMSDAYVFPPPSGTEGFAVSQIEVSVTARCNLKCRDCADCYPYYQNPAHRNTRNVIAALRKLADFSDCIEQVSILGGEPFMSPDLVEVLRAIRGIRTVNHIRIITNGSVMPGKSVFDAIAENSCMIFISHYGDLSRFADKIRQECEKRGIVCVVARNVEWHDLGSPLESRKRTEDETKRLFDGCVLGKINYLIENKLYSCARGAHIFELGLVPEANGDCFDLSRVDADDEAAREALMAFLRHPRPLGSCAHCNGFTEPSSLPMLPAAVQLQEDM